MPFISNGTTILDNGAFSVGLGSKILLATSTASASASISFTTGIDSTYKAYEFVFINIHPATDFVNFGFNLSTDSGSNYNVTKTSTVFRAYHDEADTDTTLAYQSNLDLAQSTSYQQISEILGNANDESTSGILTLFNPASTTFVKHWISNFNVVSYHNPSYTLNEYTAGYGNTTSAVNAIDFKMSSGNIDAGTIKMYGIKG